MKISAFVTVTKPSERQDPWEPAILSWLLVADEVVVVNGGRLPLPAEESRWYFLNKDLVAEGKIKIIDRKWPVEWEWSQLPKQLNFGLDACDGDWIIRFDADWVLDDSAENITRLKEALKHLGDYPAVTMQKMSTVLYDRLYQKGAQPMIINGRFKKLVRFGRATDEVTDLCYPILKEGEKDGVPYGKLIGERDRGKSGARFFNYDYTFKTKEVTQREFWRFSKAYHRYFGEWRFGETKKKAFKVFLEMMKGRLKRCVYNYGINEHPIVMREYLSELKPKQFGYNGWGLL